MMLKFLKELCTAYYDPHLDQIVGCAYGGLAWEHENRHREQFQNKWVSKIIGSYLHFLAYSLGMGFFFVGWVATNFAGGLLLLGFCSLPYGLSVIVLEIDAWIVSLRRYRRRMG